MVINPQRRTRVFIGHIKVIVGLLILTMLACSTQYKNHGGINLSWAGKMEAAEDSVGLEKYYTLKYNRPELRVYKFPSFDSFTIYTYRLNDDTVVVYKQAEQIKKIILTTDKKNFLINLINISKPYEFYTTETSYTRKCLWHEETHIMFDGDNHYVVFTNIENICLSYFYLDMLHDNDPRKIFINNFMKIIDEK